jgi:hypothetical protein
LSWLESRARYAPGQPPDEVVRSGRRTVLTRWSVPVRAGGRGGAITGTTSWLPGGEPPSPARENAGGSIPAAALLGGPLVLGLVAAAGVFGRRRERRSRSIAS